MINIKSKIAISHRKGNISIGDIGQTQLSYLNDEIMEQIPIWFEKHRREFYWYPVWIIKTNINSPELLTPNDKTITTMNI